MSTDVAGRSVERAVAPATRGGVGRHDPHRIGRREDLARRVGEQEVGPRREWIDGRVPDDGGRVPLVLVVGQEPADLGDEAEQRVEVVDRDVENHPRPEEEPDVSGELSPRPVRTVRPRGDGLVARLFRDADLLFRRVQMHAAPVALLDDKRRDGFLANLAGDVELVDDGADGTSALKEDDRILHDLLFRADEDDVVDDGGGLADLSGEVEKYLGDSLGDLACRALAHGKAVQAEEVVGSVAEAESRPDVCVIRELVEPRRSRA